uniref:tRNA wybutosine-synthesizing protein 4 n=3 Tax=Lygus hesperus TaxID=30085 RepID=A0A0A9XZA2_LYGHE
MEPLVQGTNESSTLSKYSMVQRGYFEDGAIKHFVKKDARRSPLVHLCYFARALVMDYAIKSFIQTSPKKKVQILSLGAGFDTTYFRLLPMFPDIVYFEVDLKEVVDNKIKIIERSLELSSVLVDVNDGGFEYSCFKSKHYNIFTHDLCDTEGLDHKLTQLGFEFDQPSLVFSECAITYIEEERSTALLEWIKSRIKTVTLLNYEQFNPHDGFGKIMVGHFNKIRSPLRSLMKYTSMEEQRKRYSSAGWELSRVCSVMDLFQHILKPEDTAKTFRMEPFDEWEEFHLTCCHYSLSIATANVQFLKSFPAHQHEIACRKSLVLQTIEKLTMERYGHSLVEVGNRGALIIGGFGSSSGHHGRSKEITYVGVNSKTVHTRMPSQASFITWDCLYATSTAINKEEFIIFGGRTSPTKEVNVDPVLVKVQIGDTNVVLFPMDIPLASEKRPSPRWRHAAVSHHQSLVVYGGRNKELEVFGDVWELKMNEDMSWEWTQRLFLDGRGPCARFAHAMATGDGLIYLSGGLDEQLNPLNDIWELKINLPEDKLVWRNIIPQGPMPFLYSHTMHYHQRQLIFVGGVNTSPTDQPSLTILNIDNMQAKHYYLDATASDTIVMIHNHTSFLNDDDSTISCYGGGGNCFSFGTHFNKHPLKIPIMAHV